MNGNDRECELRTWSSKLVNNTSLYPSIYRLGFTHMIGLGDNSKDVAEIV
jgi:hypothetical protein